MRLPLLLRPWPLAVITCVDQLAAAIARLIVEAHLRRVALGEGHAAPALPARCRKPLAAILPADFLTQAHGYLVRDSIHWVTSRVGGLVLRVGSNPHIHGEASS